MVLWPALGNFMGEKRELSGAGGGLPWVFRFLGMSKEICVSGYVRVCCSCGLTGFHFGRGSMVCFAPLP